LPALSGVEGHALSGVEGLGPTCHARHQIRLTPNASNARSLLTMGTSSAWACAASIRSIIPEAGAYSQSFGPYGKRIFRGHITTRGRFVPLQNTPSSRAVRFERGDLLVFRKPSRHIAVFTAGVTSGSDDPIRVVHTYGDPGVVAEQIYAVARGPLGSVWGGLRGLMDRLLGRGPYRTGVSNVEATVDEVEVIRLK
jgi:hypothetical protein